MYMMQLPIELYLNLFKCFVIQKFLSNDFHNGTNIYLAKTVGHMLNEPTKNQDIFGKHSRTHAKRTHKEYIFIYIYIYAYISIMAISNTSFI